MESRQTRAKRRMGAQVGEREKRDAMRPVCLNRALGSQELALGVERQGGQAAVSRIRVAEQLRKYRLFNVRCRFRFARTAG